MNSRRRVALCLAVACAAATSGVAGQAHPVQRDRSGTASSGIAIRPGATDPAITSFDVPHFVFVDRGIVVRRDPQRPADRRELLLWLPGTLPPGGKGQGPGGAAQFCELAAQLGYRAIVLKYPNDASASICRRDSAPDAFEDFRKTIIAGGSSRHIRVARADSIENRLIKLLQYLQRTRSDENWQQFLNDDATIKWERIAVAGQSQGGGHAALIGIMHRVARVICLGAPKDHSLGLGKPAAWLTHESATPKDRFFAFNHLQDRQGCSPAEQLDNLRALKLDAFGPVVNVDDASPPYAHTRCLTTNYPGGKVDSGTAHTSVSAGRSAGVFNAVWTYMLTESHAPKS